MSKKEIKQRLIELYGKLWTEKTYNVPHCFTEYAEHLTNHIKRLEMALTASNN